MNLRHFMFALLAGWAMYACGEITRYASAETVIFEIGAAWCSPCRAMAPVIRQLKAEGVKVFTYDFDTDTKIVERLKVTRLPTFIAFTDGNETSRIVGQVEIATLRTMANVTLPKRLTHRSNFTLRSNVFPHEFLVQAANRAEQCRRDEAIEWLGRELPDWPEPCQVTMERMPDKFSGGGSTSFGFHDGTVDQFTGTWKGNEQNLIDDVIPHEVLHAVFAEHFRQPLPRWCDEGAATYCESATSRKFQNAQLLDNLRANTAFPTHQMMQLLEYPRGNDRVMSFYAQAASAAAFLIEAGGKPEFVNAIVDALQIGWQSSIAKHYEIESLTQFQADWLEWVRAGSPPAPVVYEASYAPNDYGKPCRCRHRWHPLQRLWLRLQQRRHGQVSTPGQRQAAGDSVAPRFSGPIANAVPGPSVYVQPPLVDVPKQETRPDVVMPDQSNPTSVTLGDVQSVLDRIGEKIADAEAKLAERQESNGTLIGHVKDVESQVAPIVVEGVDTIKETGSVQAGVKAVAVGGLTGMLVPWVGPAAPFAANAIVALGGAAALWAGNGLRTRLSASGTATPSSPSSGSQVTLHRVVAPADPIIVQNDSQPLPQIVERTRQFVEVQVPTDELRGLQMAMDSHVQRFPGSRATIEALESAAKQIASGLKKQRGAGE